MRTSVILAFALILSACGVARPVLDRDNTKVEVKTVEKVVRDTASVLENKYAKSAALVSGGVLTHSLETKPVREPVTVETKEIVRDSIVYRDRVQTVTKEVEKPLTGWQQAKLRVGGVCFFVIIIYGIYLIIRFIYKPNLFKL